MIRNFEMQDLDKIMNLWLDTNISTHFFIDSEYWKGNYNVVKEMMPDTSIYIYEDGETIKGFIGLTDNYILGIFVLQQVQSKGIGRKLLDCVKSKKDKLSLSVYKKNNRAINFYLREGFVISDEQIDENTREVEFSMTWVR